MDALRALKVRGVYTVFLWYRVHHVKPSDNSSASAQAQRILWAAARPRGGKGEPAAASRPAWQKASIKGRLEGQRLTQGGQPGVPHIFKGYAHKFTLFYIHVNTVRVSAFTEKQEASKPPHALALKRSCRSCVATIAAFCPVS